MNAWFDIIDENRRYAEDNRCRVIRFSKKAEIDNKQIIFYMIAQSRVNDNRTLDGEGTSNVKKSRMVMKTR